MMHERMLSPITYFFVSKRCSECSIDRKTLANYIQRNVLRVRHTLVFCFCCGTLFLRKFFLFDYIKAYMFLYNDFHAKTNPEKISSHQSLVKSRTRLL